MKELTLERLKELIRYDPITGEFFRIALSPRSKAKLGLVTLYAKDSGHLRMSIDGGEYYAARVAHYYMTGDWGEIVDHRDGDPNNNRWLNLRNTTPLGNVQNQVRAHHHNKSGLLGAHWREDKQKYESAVWHKSKRYRLGYFDTAEAAHEAYKQKKRELHVTCTI
ncbi:hypothetical protein [Burkholderia phage vB_BpP_HN04]|nr:HNH endonuclease [Burkholderia phage vB_BpP_HN01]